MRSSYGIQNIIESILYLQNASTEMEIQNIFDFACYKDPEDACTPMEIQNICK